MYKKAIIIKTVNKIDKKRGQRILSSNFISGYITKASNTEITKGKITDEAIFNTAPARIQQIISINEKIARPEWKFLEIFFIFYSIS